MIAGDELMPLQLNRSDMYTSLPEGYNLADQKMDIFLTYPTYYTVLECCNHSTTVTVNPNRYIVTRDTWDMVRQRAGSALRDTLGMRYTVPIAMSSMESLAGFPAFIST